jgi:3-oxoacyl-[acyl-carrier-protein] synthase III
VCLRTAGAARATNRRGLFPTCGRDTISYSYFGISFVSPLYRDIAMTQLLGVALRGTGSCLPARVVRNDEFTDVLNLDTSDEWIRTRTGIRERRFAGLGETSASLGTIAARNAIEASGLTPHDIDLIVCATITPDFMSPSTANLIQTGLGCRQIPAFDISAACSGFLYAMSVAAQFVRTGAAKHALVVGAEVLTRIVDYSDRNSCILFGDGAGAVVLSATPVLNTGVRTIRLYSDASRQELIQVPSRVTSNPPPGPPQVQRLEYLRISGREVFRFAVTRMVELIEQAEIDVRELGLNGIDVLIPHQVNQRIIDAALESSGFPKEKVVVNLDRYGNTSAASVPIAMDEALRTGRCKPGDVVLLVAFGGGLTWSSALLTL